VPVLCEEVEDWEVAHGVVLGEGLMSEVEGCVLTEMLGEEPLGIVLGLAAPGLGLVPQEVFPKQKGLGTFSDCAKAGGITIKKNKLKKIRIKYRTALNVFLSLSY
jgi:hypothetical protein